MHPCDVCCSVELCCECVYLLRVCLRVGVRYIRCVRDPLILISVAQIHVPSFMSAQPDATDKDVNVDRPMSQRLFNS